jgi:cytochrome c
MVNAITVLADGRVITGGDDGRVLVWDPDTRDRGPAESDRYPQVDAVTALPDGRLVTGDRTVNGQVMVWGTTVSGRFARLTRQRQRAPSELGRNDGGTTAIGVLPDGRIVTGGAYGQVLAWDTAAAQPARQDRATTASGSPQWQCCPTGG